MCSSPHCAAELGSKAFILRSLSWVYLLLVRAADARKNRPDTVAYQVDVHSLGEVRVGRLDVCVEKPILMSCAYAGFAIEPEQWRYLQYDDTGIVFRRAYGATYMAPSVDTIVCCSATRELSPARACCRDAVAFAHSTVM